MAVAQAICLAVLAVACLPVALWGILSGLRPHYERWRDLNEKSKDYPDRVIWGFAYFEMIGRVFMGGCLAGISALILWFAWGQIFS